MVLSGNYHCCKWKKIKKLNEIRLSVMKQNNALFFLNSQKITSVGKVLHT